MTCEKVSGTFNAMPTPDTRYTPRDQVQHLTNASWENLIERLAVVVARSSEQLFGKVVESKLIGTFNGFALAESVEGAVVRFQYEGTAAGAIVLKDPKQLTLKSVRTSDFVSEQALATVDALLVGQVDKAFDLLKPVIPMLSETTKISAPATVVEEVLSVLESPRPWKVFMAAQAAAPSVEEGASKFAKLYDGSFTASELTTYSDLVQSDFKDIVESFRSLSLTAAASHLKLAATGDAQMANLAEDYAVDVEFAVNKLQAASEKMFVIPHFARITDAAVKAFPSFAFADTFLNQAADAAALS